MNARLDINTNLWDKKICLDAYFTTPLKVIDITEKESEGMSLMLVSSSPGILAGDRYNVNINIGPNSKVDLQTQSFQRIFTMQGEASQDYQINIERGATFKYLPHPTVPHAGSYFVARNTIHLTPTSTLLWGEVLSCGRKLNNEIFKFRKLQMITEIRIDKKLVVKENLNIEPSLHHPQSLGHYEGFTHQSSLLFFNAALNTAEAAERLQEVLLQEADIQFGITSLPANGLLVKMLGNGAEHLFSLQKQLARQLELLTATLKPLTNAI